MPDDKREPNHPQPPGTGEPPVLERAVDPGAHARALHRRQVTGFLAGLSLSLPLVVSFSWLWPSRRSAWPDERPNSPPTADPVLPPAAPAPVSLPPGVACGAPGLVLELSARRRKVKNYAPVVKFRASLVNAGSLPVTVVLPGDGSEYGLRTPILRWDPPSARRVGCGHIDTATMDEIVVIRPGKRRSLGELNWATEDGPGIYAVTLELEHEPLLEWRGIHGTPPRVLERMRSVPPFRVRSNAVEIEVVA